MRYAASRILSDEGSPWTYCQAGHLSSDAGIRNASLFNRSSDYSAGVGAGRTIPAHESVFVRALGPTEPYGIIEIPPPQSK